PSLTKDPPPPDPPTRRRQVRDAAAAYIAQGWGVLPLKASDKMPTKRGWREPGYKATPDDFGEGHDIGVLTGAQSFVPGKGYLCCGDWDSKDALAKANATVPAEFLAKFRREGRPGNPNSHWWVYVAPRPAGLGRLHPARRRAEDLQIRQGQEGN